MKCPRCGLMIAGLACPACTALQSREALIKMLPTHMPNVRAGRLNFYAKRLSVHHPWHLMLFGDKSHGWCGVEIQATGPNNRWDMPYRELPKLNDKEFCPKCRRALDQIEEREAIREES